jgi:hypothetical protein
MSWCSWCRNDLHVILALLILLFHNVRSAKFIGPWRKISQLESREASEPKVYENRKGNRSARVHLNVESKIDPFSRPSSPIYMPLVRNHVARGICVPFPFSTPALCKSIW